MNLNALVNRGMKTAALKSPEILTALGVTGVVTTAWMAAKAGWRIAKSEESAYPSEPPKERAVRMVKTYWPEAVPPVVAGAATAAAIVGSHHISAKRTAAAVAAYSLAEQALSEYRAKVVETIGANKEEVVRGHVAEDKVRATPPAPADLMVVGDKDVLCCDLMTMRYFRSDMQTLKAAVNELNSRLLREGWMSVEEFYHLIDVWPGVGMDRFGWKMDKLMGLEFNAILTEDNQPCMAFAYVNLVPL
jgi:hypothetical protein